MRILIVEDETRLAETLRQLMEDQRYQADTVGDGADGVDYGLTGQYDLIILDVMLPKVDGFEVARRLRSAHISTPILMLTARDDTSDKIGGLDCGADDYMTKPFDSGELMARVRTALRHAGQNQPKEKTYSLGSLFVDPERHIVRDGDRDVTLTLKEFQVLCLLMERAGTVFTRDQLLNTIWGYEFDGASRTVDVHIRTLRQKLGEAGSCIQTIRGIGYKIGGTP